MAKLNAELKPVDDRIAHWTQELDLWKTDIDKYFELISQIPEELDGQLAAAAFPGYDASKEKF